MRFLPFLLLAACPLEKLAGDTADTAVDDTGGEHSGSSVRLAELFPYDGSREASYFQDGVEDQLHVEKTDVDDDGGTEVVTWTWTNDTTGARVGRLSLSATADDGVFFHAWTDADDVLTTCDPPLALTEAGDRLWDDAPVITETAGRTFTVSLVGREDCPVQWGLDWEDCTRIRIDDGDGDDSAGPFFAGDWWLVDRYGPAWMHVTGQSERWDLARYDWSAE